MIRVIKKLKDKQRNKVKRRRVIQRGLIKVCL